LSSIERYIKGLTETPYRGYLKPMSRKGLLLAFSLLSVGLFSCGEGEKYNLTELSKELNATVKPLSDKEKERVTSIVSTIFPKTWKVIDIFKVEPSEERYLKKYLVKVYSEYEHAIYNRYIWFTDDGKVLFTQGYLVGNKTVSPIIPPKAKEYPLENIGWILDIERIVYSANLPTTLTVGKKTVYIVWNPYCRVCFEKWKEILDTAQKEHLTLKLISYHNVYYPIDNLYMLIYILYKAQREGLASVLNEYYNSYQKFEDFIEALKKDAYANLPKIPKNDYNNIGYALKQISQTLGVARIFIVPTTIRLEKVNTQLGTASGYVYVGEVKLIDGKK
jgi:hypothetical protein